MFEERYSRRGFTLVELILSMIIMSMIVLGVGSSLVLALRAAEANRNPSTIANQAELGQSAVEQLQSDLKVATATTSSATGCTLTVPDRNGDGTAETIVYSWAGPGSPLMRQYNSQPAVSIADGVQNFNLSWYTRTLSAQGGTTTESAEQAGHTDVPALQLDLFDFIHAGGGILQADAPLQCDLLEDHPRTGFAARQSASTLTLKIMPTDASLIPLLSTLGSTTASASAIPKNGDLTIDFKFATPVANLSPYQNYCIVVGSSASGTGVNHATLTLNGNMAWTTSANSGSTWAATSSTTAMQFTVYGTYTTGS